MNAFDAVAPPDKVDRTPMDEALKALLGALASVHNPKPSVTLTLGEAEWARARTYYQRPYQRKPTSEFGVYLADGTAWFQREAPDLREVLSVTADEPLDVRDLEPGQIIRIPPAAPPIDPAVVTERALDTATATMGTSSSVTSTARDSGAVYGGPWVAPEDR